MLDRILRRCNHNPILRVFLKPAGMDEASITQPWVRGAAVSGAETYVCLYVYIYIYIYTYVTPRLQARVCVRYQTRVCVCYQTVHPKLQALVLHRIFRRCNSNPMLCVSPKPAGMDEASITQPWVRGAAASGVED